MKKEKRKKTKKKLKPLSRKITLSYHIFSVCVCVCVLLDCGKEKTRRCRLLDSLRSPFHPPPNQVLCDSDRSYLLVCISIQRCYHIRIHLSAAFYWIHSFCLFPFCCRFHSNRFDATVYFVFAMLYAYYYLWKRTLADIRQYILCFFFIIFAMPLYIQTIRSCTFSLKVFFTCKIFLTQLCLFLSVHQSVRWMFFVILA